MSGLRTLRPLFTISRRCQVLGLMSPVQMQIQPSNFHRWLIPRHRFRKCNEIVDLVGYVGEGAPQISKKHECTILWCCGEKVYMGMDPGIVNFCRQDSLLMHASNLACRCCIVSPLKGANWRTIENYPLHKVLQNPSILKLFIWVLPMPTNAENFVKNMSPFLRYEFF